MLAVLILANESEAALADALAARPDWLVLTVEPASGEAGSGLSLPAVQAYLTRLGARPNRPRLFVRIPPLAPAGADEILASVMTGRPDGVMLGRAVGRRALEQLAARLAVLEAEHGLEDGATRILPCIETAEGALVVQSLSSSGPRLAGLAWDERALRADLGLDIEAPERPAPCRHLSATLVLTAAAAKVPAIDTPSFREGWAQDLARARQDGFSGKLTLDPGQTPSIQEA